MTLARKERVDAEIEADADETDEEEEEGNVFGVSVLSARFNTADECEVAVNANEDSCLLASDQEQWTS
jgi:hypothetical protein